MMASSLRPSFILTLFYFGLCFTGTSSQTVDLTRVPGSSGAEVVNAVLDILRKSCVFPDDNSFLRRVAYVDSADGTQNYTYRAGYYGGIWQINEDVFNATKTDASLEPYRQLIQSQLFINWTSVQWQDLTKPLYSGIAAQLALIQALGGNAVPVTVEDQAALWDNGQGNANVFFAKVNQLNKARISYKDVDVVFVLDSSSSLSSADFGNTKDFVEKVIEGFDIDADRVNVAVLEYSTVPKLIFGLDNNMTKAEIQTKVANMTYMPGGTATNTALEYVRDNIFKNGTRLGRSKIVILVTDGRSNDKVSTISTARQLRASGVTIFTVGVGSLVDQKELSAVSSPPGSIYIKTVSNFTELPSVNYEILKILCCGYSLEKTLCCGYSLESSPQDDSNEYPQYMKELSAVASSPGCIYMKTVSNFTELPSVNYEIQQLSLQATVNLAPATYNFACDSNMNVRISSDNGKDRTIEITSSDGRVHIFGSGSPSYTPNSAIYTFNDTVDGQSVVQIYVRDGSEVFLTFRNGTTKGCTSNFNIKVLVGDHITSGSKVTCISNRLVSKCTPSDLVKSPFVITGTPSPQLPNFCSSFGTIVMPHPVESDRYIYCYNYTTVIIYCNQGEVFDRNLKRCVKGGPIAPIVTTRPGLQSTTSSPGTNQQTKPAVTSNPGQPIATIIPPGSTTPLINPCTPEHISQGLMVWPYPPDNTSFIHCDSFAFSGNVQKCDPHKYYEHTLQTCLYADVVISAVNGTFSGLANPCTKNFKGDVQYHPYPGNPHLFIQCDAFGDAFVKQCRLNEIWEQNVLNCIPNGFKFDKLVG